MWTSAKPIKETFHEVNVFIWQLAMTKITFYQLDYHFRAVEPTTDESLINMGPLSCQVCRQIHHYTKGYLVQYAQSALLISS